MGKGGASCAICKQTQFAANQYLENRLRSGVSSGPVVGIFGRMMLEDIIINQNRRMKKSKDRLLKLFEQNGFYAIENWDGVGNIHRISLIQDGKIITPFGDWEPVEDYFVDLDGLEFKGLKVVFLPGFTRKWIGGQTNG